MKKNCNIIKDLLPLYIDEVCSKESSKLVEEHLKDCDDCQNYLEELKFDIKESKVNEINGFKKFAKLIDFKIIKDAIAITCIILVITYGILYFITNFHFTSNYSEKMDVIIHEDGRDWNIQFMTPIMGRQYGILRRINENGENTNVIFITHKYTLEDYFSSEKYSRYGTEIEGLYFQYINYNDKTKVYYTNEDLNDINDAGEEKLKNIINKSTLIFTNEATSSTMNCTLNNQDYSYTLTYYTVNKQIIESSGDLEMPEELLMHILSIDGDYDSMWFPGDKSTDTFNKIEQYMTNKGGTCKLDTNDN